MNKFEYNCFWMDIFNATNLQDILDDKGKMGWEIVTVVPNNEVTSYQRLFILKRKINKEEEAIIL